MSEKIKKFIKDLREKNLSSAKEALKEAVTERQGKRLQKEINKLSKKDK